MSPTGLLEQTGSWVEVRHSVSDWRPVPSQRLKPRSDLRILGEAGGPSLHPPDDVAERFLIGRELNVNVTHGSPFNDSGWKDTEHVFRICLVVGLVLIAGCGGNATTTTVTAQSNKPTTELNTSQVASLRDGAGQLSVALDAYSTAAGNCIEIAKSGNVEQFAKCPRTAANSIQPTLAQVASDVTDMSAGLGATACNRRLVEYAGVLYDIHDSIELAANRSEQMDFDGATAATATANRLMQEVAKPLKDALKVCVQ